MVKVALIGYGYAGQVLHAPLIASVSGMQLIAIVSGRPDKVLADYPQMTVCATIDELPSGVDLVVIATPNHSHFELAQRALLAGNHVVVDKPFTVTAAQARELSVLAEKMGRVLSIFHNRRWDADFMTLRDVIASAQLGELVSFESRFDRYRPEINPRWREQSGSGTGLWYDLGPHLVDQAVQLFGRPMSVEADFAMQRPGAEAIDYFKVDLHYKRLCVSLNAGMLSSAETPRYVLKGSGGSYTKFGRDVQEASLKHGELPGCDGWGQDPRSGVMQKPRELEASAVPNLPGDYRRFYSMMRDCIALNTANPVPPDEAVRVMVLIELACESAQMQQRIFVSGHA
ncbi:MAG: oxidoreductase [Nitrosomonadales bacterium]